MRCLEPLALMVSADRVPFCLAGSIALDIRRVVPIPGNMIRERTDMTFVYVSLAERRDISLAEMPGIVAAPDDVSP
jgi:hypothetical protein